MRILIMGLPGAGKTTLAQTLRDLIQDNNKTVEWFNADLVRQAYDDWDFSTEGRVRQSVRMRELAEKINSDYVVCDFVCPLCEIILMQTL
jgi:adenylylsulfate kinase